jgi:hypothetical protein
VKTKDDDGKGVRHLFYFSISGYTVCNDAEVERWLQSQAKA